MNLKKILEYTLLSPGETQITVFDLLVVIMILVITRIIIWVIRKVINRQIKAKRVEAGSGHALIQIIRYFLWILAILVALETMDIKITILLAGSAALLVGLGLGLQQIFKDLVSGLFLLFEGHLKVDDVVEIGDLVGKVKSLGFRTTKVESRDNITVIIPNSQFITQQVINWSHHQKLTRFNVTVGVAYGSDVPRVEKVLLACAKDMPDIAKKPEPYVMFTDFGNSSLDFKLFFWSDNNLWIERTKSNLRFRINEQFKQNGITIPFPQRDVHLKSGNWGGGS